MSQTRWSPDPPPILLLLILTINLVSGQQKLDNPVCNYWPDRGSCNEFRVKWYYDSYDHRCRRFYFGGCDGNANRFDSLEDCSSACKFDEPTNRDRCFQPHDPGHCQSDIERWFYDSAKKQCVCSWWSGCGGNSNIYYSYKHCMQICGDYTQGGPGIDENYWGKRNSTTMSIESKNVFEHKVDKVEDSLGIYSVQVPQYHEQEVAPVWVNISHFDDIPLRYMESGRERILWRPNYPVYARHARILNMADHPIQLSDTFPMPKRRGPMIKKRPPKMIQLTNKVNPPTILETNSLEPSYTLDRKAEDSYVLKAEVTTTTTEMPATTADPAVLSQFHDYLEDHKEKLRRQLEAQFPGHEITLIPQVETVTYPDGRHIVRQRIQWTARPRGANFRPTERILPVTTVAPMSKTTVPPSTTTVPSTTLEPTQSEYELRKQRQKEKHRKMMEEQRKRVEEYQRQQEERKRQWEEQQKKFEEDKKRKIQEAEESLKKHREAIEKSRREHEEARRKYEEEQRTRMQATRPPLYYQDRHIIPTVTHPTVPSSYSEVAVQRPIYDATRQPYYRPEPRPTVPAVTAEPVNFYRPLVATVTPESLSLEDIIAIDQSKDYEDDYDVPAVLPPHQTTVAPRPVTPAPAPRQRQQDPRSNLSPIVFPAQGGSDIEYAQNLDFGDYMK